MAFKQKFSILSKLGENGKSGVPQAVNQNQVPKPSLRDEVDELLLPVFLDEADELLPKISEGLQALHDQPDDKQRHRTLSRLLHTFKGGARMAGAMRIGELAHSMEDIVQSAAQKLDRSKYRTELNSIFDQIHNMIEKLRDSNVQLENPNLSKSISHDALPLNLVPFSCISERLYRIVRQTGKDLNKRAKLKLSGTDVLVDRVILDKMTASFEHLLRNAIAHGLETPEQRKLSGKPIIGEIHLSVRQESNQIVIALSDDGAGLDMARLQQKAVESGFLREGERISIKQAGQLIFMPGVTTAKEVTETAGRGVGLDVVKNEVFALAGQIAVDTNSGGGVCFTIHLPLNAKRY